MKSDNMWDRRLRGVATTIAESPKGVTQATCLTGPQENAQRSLQRWRPMQLYSQPLETRTAETSIGPAPKRMCPEGKEWVEAPGVAPATDVEQVVSAMMRMNRVDRIPVATIR
jgi:hypothetical protein